MKVNHSLLARQLKRYFPQPGDVPRSLMSFVDAVDAAYREFDLDRSMLERSLDISSHELLQANAEMREVHKELEKRVEMRTLELSEANRGLKREIAERKRFEAQLLHIASHDSLTDLYNRRHFEQEVEAQLQLSRLNDSQGALIFLDIDQFKDVNDTLGHGVGDELLRSLVDLLRSCLRGPDVLARLGGDEFAILLPDTSAVRARAMAHQIEAVIRRHTFWLDEHPVSVTASIGVAVYPRHGSTTAKLLSNADMAMYHAKGNGRGRIEVFRPNRDWRLVSETRLRWRNLIVEALEKDRFVLYAQPIHDLRQASIEHYEVLLRLPTASGRVVRPGMFMDVVEKFGLAPLVDRWVVRQSFRLLESQQRNGRPIRLSVNLSGKSLGDTELLNLIRSQLATTRVDPASLVLEVTETAAIGNLNQAQRFVRTLNELGVYLALDDFGAGFSSFSHLKHLPVHYLKIDGSFIKDLPGSEVDRQLVQAMVAVAKGLGKQTIAEFVGSQETVDLLAELGVDLAQGDFLGRPRPVEQVLDAARIAA